MESFPSIKAYRLMAMKTLDRHERELSDLLDNPVIYNHCPYGQRSEELLKTYRTKLKEARHQFMEEHLYYLKRFG
jgi:hypothetical protein